MKKIAALVIMLLTFMSMKSQNNTMSDTIVGPKIFGVINVSVGNIRTGPDFETELETQALLGQPVKILRKNGWYKIETPDGYKSWIHRMQIVPMTRAEINSWNLARKVIVTTPFAFAYSRPQTSSQVVSDIVAGDQLKYLGTTGQFYWVEYPDGRKAYLLIAQAQPFNEWVSTRRFDANHIISTAKSLYGIPYLWGGTSVKGVDCSGFVWTAAFLNWVILPRNASEMIKIGERLIVAKDFSNLQPGDLVFFGHKAAAGKKERVSHVGIYIGNRKFIHSLGMVHISSFNPKDTDYDEYDLNRFIGATRFLNHVGEYGITKIQLNKLYQRL